MSQISTEDIPLANRIARFLHATIGEEGKLWKSAMQGKITIFTIAEANAFRFTAQVFDAEHDKRLTIKQGAGDEFGNSVGRDATADREQRQEEKASCR